jgi:hypothetical protein
MSHKSYELRLIHNVRRTVELSDAPRWAALMTIAGVVIALAAVLMLVFRG